MSNIAILDEAQLRTLATTIWHQETEAVQNIRFSSGTDQDNYLNDCSSNYNSVIILLDLGVELKDAYRKDKTKAPIAHDIFSYIENCANNALQTVRNYHLRKNYLKKISSHAIELQQELARLNPKIEADVEALAKNAATFRNAMLEYTRNYQSPASRSYSRWLKDTGLTFEELVQSYMLKRTYEGPFDLLDEDKKIQIYEDIIEASGRGRQIVNKISKALGAFGLAVLLATAAMMAWDIFSSDHVFPTATYDAVMFAASIGGAMLGEFIAVVVATQVADFVGASVVFVVVAGLVGSVGGAFILGAFAGWMIELILESGGSAPLSTDGLHCYVAPMPDSVELARQIVHK